MPKQHIPAAAYVLRGDDAGMRGNEKAVQPNGDVLVYWFPPLPCWPNSKLVPSWEDPNQLTIVHADVWEAARYQKGKY